MKKLGLFAAVAAAVSLTSGVSFADDANMEHCAVVKDGKGMIMAGKGSCKTANHSCAGLNKDGEVDAWIAVPAGECAKINAGDCSGVPGVADKLAAGVCK